MRHTPWLSSMLLVCALGAGASSAASAAAGSSQQQRLTPQGAMRALAEAIEIGDEAAIAECFFVQDDPDGAVVGAVSRQLLASREYWKSMCRTFGRRAAIEAYVRRRMILPDGYLDYPDARWSVDGDRATLVRKDEQSPRAPSPLLRVEGRWLVDVAPNAATEERNRIVTEMDRAARRYSDAAAAVENGNFPTVHDAIASLYPTQKLKREILAARPVLTPEQLDPGTISGSIMSLGQAVEQEDAAAARNYYAVDATGGEELIRAHVRRLLAVNRFVSAVAEQIEETESLAAEFEMIDPRDDFYGHLTTRWTPAPAGDRATGKNDEGLDLALVKRDGAWRIDLTPGDGDQDARSIAARLEHQSRAVATVTRAITDRQLFTVNEVRQALKRAGLTPVASEAVPAAGASEATVNE